MALLVANPLGFATVKPLCLLPVDSYTLVAKFKGGYSASASLRIMTLGYTNQLGAGAKNAQEFK